MRLLDVLRGETDDVSMDMDRMRLLDDAQKRPAHSTRAHALHEEPMLAEWERALRVSGDMAVAKLVLAKRHGVSRRSMAAKLRWTAAQHREKENAM